MRSAFTALMLLAVLAAAAEAAVKSVSVPLVARAPSVDGKLTEGVWQKAARVQLDAAVAKSVGKALRFASDARLLRTDKSFFVGVRCEHPQAPVLRSSVQPRDGRPHLDESVEVFIDRRDGSPYFQFITNASGSVYDGRGYDGSWNGVWKSRATIGEGAWSVEMELPFETLGGAPERGTYWSLNICRNAYRGDDPVEYSAWVYPGHHHPVGLLFCGPVRVAEMIPPLGRRLAELEASERALSTRDKKEIERFRALARGFRERSGASGMLEPALFLKFLDDSETISAKIGLLAAKAKLNDMFGEPREEVAANMRLLPGDAFVVPNRKIVPDRTHGFSLNCLDTSDALNEKPFCEIHFGGISARYCAKLDRVCRVPDMATGSVYELYHVVNGEKEFWVGRRLKACGGGVWVDVAVSKECAGDTFSIRIQGRRNRMGDVYTIGAKRYSYPVLPMVANKRKIEKYPIRGGDCLRSSADPARAYTMCAMDGLKVWTVDTSINSDGRGSSILTGFYGDAPVSFFFSPSGANRPVPNWVAKRGKDPVWLTDAVRKVLEVAAPQAEQWRHETDEMMAHVRNRAAVRANQNVMKLYRQFATSTDCLAVFSERLASGAMASFDDWVAIGQSMHDLREMKRRLERELAFHILF